jgi:hypothetical protein
MQGGLLAMLLLPSAKRSRDCWQEEHSGNLMNGLLVAAS